MKVLNMGRVPICTPPTVVEVTNIMQYVSVASFVSTHGTNHLYLQNFADNITTQKDPNFINRLCGCLQGNVTEFLF